MPVLQSATSVVETERNLSTAVPMPAAAALPALAGAYRSSRPETLDEASAAEWVASWGGWWNARAPSLCAKQAEQRTARRGEARGTTTRWPVPFAKPTKSTPSLNRSMMSVLNTYRAGGGAHVVATAPSCMLGRKR